jgi:hypothetical protein
MPTAVAWLVVAQAAPPARPSWHDPRLVWASVALAALILVGVGVILWLDRWRKGSAPKALSADEQLAQFRELYERGDLSQQEFERIRARLLPQLRDEWDVPAKPAPPGEPPPPPDTGIRPA